MSFVRTALAATVLEALCPAAALAGTADFPTEAGAHVFLEREDPLDDLAPDHRAPTISIYTGVDTGSALSSATSEMRRQIEVEIVLALVARVTAEDGESILHVPVTDRDLSDALSVLESQVWFALREGPTGIYFRQLRKQVVSTRCEPAREAQEGFRLAERHFTMLVDVPDDCYVAAPTAPLEGLARLPRPLRDVAHLLPADLAAALIGAAPVAPVITPLARVDFDIEFGPSDPAAHVTAEVPIPQD